MSKLKITIHYPQAPHIPLAQLIVFHLGLEVGEWAWMEYGHLRPEIPVW